MVTKMKGWKSRFLVFPNLMIGLILFLFMCVSPLVIRPFIDRYQTIGYKPLVKESLSWLELNPTWFVDLIEVSTSVTLEGVVHPPKNPDSPWVLFFHGNSSFSFFEMKSFYERLNPNQDWGFAMWSYRGYGTSGGASTRETMRRDSIVIVDKLFNSWNVRPEQLRILGFSLGNLPTSYLANSLSTRGTPPAGVVFMATGWRPKGYLWTFLDSFNSDLYFRNGVISPMLITHGERDAIHEPADALEDFLALEHVDAEFLMVSGGHAHLSDPIAKERIVDFINTPRTLK